MERWTVVTNYEAVWYILPHTIVYVGHSTAGFSILNLSGKRATNLFCDIDNFETCIYSVRPEQSNILMLYKRSGPDLTVQ